MFSPSRACGLLMAALVMLFGQVHALFEDQRGQFDWYQAYLGHAIGACFSEEHRQLVVGTESGIVGAVSLKGDIVWRHVYGTSDKVDAVACVDDLVVVASSGGQYLRAFSMGKGALVWEKAGYGVEGARAALGVTVDGRHLVMATTRGVHMWQTAAFSEEPATIALDGRGSVASLSISNGQLYVVTADNESAMAVEVDLETMAVQAQVPVSANPPSLLVGPQAVSVNGTTLLAVSLAEGGVPTGSELEALLGEPVAGAKLISVGQAAANQGLVGVQYDGATALLAVSGTSVSVVRRWKGVYALGSEIIVDGVFVVAATVEENQARSELLREDSGTWRVVDENVGEMPSTARHGKAVRAFTIVKVVEKDSRKVAHRAFVGTADHAWTLLGTSKVLFTREEGLASVVNARFVDLPSDQSEVSLLMKGFMANEEDTSVPSHFINRITAQAIHIKRMVKGLIKNGLSLLTAVKSCEKEKLTADTFGLRKVVVVITAPGKAYGIFSSNGNIIWSTILQDGDFTPSKHPLFLARSAANYLHPPVVWVLGTSGAGTLVAYSLNPITGEAEKKTYDFEPVTALMVQHADDVGAFPVIVMDNQQKVHVLGLSEKAVSVVDSVLDTLHLYTVNEVTGRMKGYRVTRLNGELMAQSMWSVVLSPETETIVKVANKQQYEPIKLQFSIVDEKQTILYKYLNPNLLVVLTINKDDMMSLFLLDTVTGSILHRATHSNAGQPINAIQFEHTVLYQYYDKELQRYQVVVNDLFEAAKPEERIPFESSQAGSPMVARQAYVFPMPFAVMGVTITQQNIAYRQILLGLGNGALYALDRKFVDTRRPNKELVLPDVPPYQPGLPYNPQNIINYDQTLHNIREIVTAPTHLESHGMVFTYGAELFCAQVVPSGNFDRLSEDFNKPVLSATVAGMIGAAMVTGHMARKKQLQLQWK